MPTAKRLSGLAVAVGAVALATALTLLLRPYLERGVFALYLGAVLGSAFYGGLGPGLLATVLSVLASDYLFMVPRYSLAIHSVDDIAVVVIFSVVAVMISILDNANKRAQSALRASNAKLEDRAKERTAWLNLVYDITGAAHETETVEQAYRFVLRRISTVGPWRYAQLYTPSRDDATLLAPTLSSVSEDKPGFRSLRDTAAKLRIKAGQSGVGRVWETGAVEWTRLERRESLPGVEAAFDVGMRTAVAFPVIVERKAIAVFECFSEQALERDQNLVDLLGAVGLETGLIIHRKQLQEDYAEAVWKQQRETAQELHDDLGQRLTGLGFLSRSLSDQLKSTEFEKPAHRLMEGIEQAVNQIRGLAKGVFPVDLDSEGLMAALGQLATDMGSAAGVPCRFECPDRVLVPENRVAMHLYRIAQEALTNALKHGRPTRVVLSLSSTPGEIRLAVQDDGTGIPDARQRAEGTGLRIMRYRAAALAGNLKVERAAGGGTLVTCAAPRPDRNGSP